MKTFVVFVTTIDGKITKWGDPIVRAWSSREDQSYFTELMKNSELVVMGSNTYTADPIKPRENRLIVVMTSKPGRYKNQEVAGQLEFTNESPARLIEHYSNTGFKEMLVAGGPHIATSFLKEDLIDEVWLTIEPLIFGTGGNFVIQKNLDLRLKLFSVEKMNEAGTLLLKYGVVKR